MGGGGGGGTTIDWTEEREDDLDLDLLVFLDFFDLPDLLDLRFADFLEVEEATGTEPKVPPKAVGVPKTPAGIGTRGTIGLVGN